MDLFSPVSSILPKWSNPMLGVGSSSASYGVQPEAYSASDILASNSSGVSADPFLTAVLDRWQSGSSGAVRH